MAKITAILKTTLSLRRDIALQKLPGYRQVPMRSCGQWWSHRGVLTGTCAQEGGDAPRGATSTSRRTCPGRFARAGRRGNLRREVKRGNPSVVCNLQYDKLYVNHRCCLERCPGRVVPYTAEDESPGPGQDHVGLTVSSFSLKTSPTMMYSDPCPGQHQRGHRRLSPRRTPGSGSWRRPSWPWGASWPASGSYSPVSLLQSNSQWRKIADNNQTLEL